ncbi:MAG TPA: ImmA/IrrE family metallo-endopeptidase [Acidimicrobiia bacterium]
MTSQYFERYLALGLYTLRLQAAPEHDVDLAEAGVVGDSNLDAGIIRVRSDLPRQRQREVVMHELLHHVVHMTHLEARWDDDEQEEVIRALSPWLVQLVTINNYEW